MAANHGHEEARLEFNGLPSVCPCFNVFIGHCCF